MIYVIRAANTNLVKIGFTHNHLTLQERIKSIATGCPHKLAVEATMSGSLTKERCMHGFCIKRHERGEWFRLSPDEVSRMIAKYKNWSPLSAGIRGMPCIHHQIKGSKAKPVPNWPNPLPL